MLPPKKNNIYPKTDENLLALFGFYFDKFDVDHDKILDTVKRKTSLSLNQLEFIFRKLSEAYIPIFKKHLTIRQIALTNLFMYGFDALESEMISKGGSKNRQLITQEFKDFVNQTEINFK